MRTSPRLALLIVATVVTVAGLAQAAELNGGMIKLNLDLPQQESDGSVSYEPAQGPEAPEQFFNAANCECAAANPGNEPALWNFGLRTVIEGSSSADYPPQTVQVWVGDDCDTRTPSERDLQCEKVSELSVDDVAQNETFAFNTSDFMYPNAETCETSANSTGGQSTIYFAIDQDDNSEFDMGGVFSIPFMFDAAPPLVPPDLAVRGGEGRVIVSWGTERNADIDGAQLLCATMDGTPATNSDLEPMYQIPERRCDLETKTPITSAVSRSEDGPDAGTPLMTPEFVEDSGLFGLDEAFLCGEIGPGQNEVSAGGLENGTTYRIVLVLVDKARNARVIDLGQATPQPVDDFWENYYEAGGKADQGVCLATATYGDDHFFTNLLRDFRDEVLAPLAPGRAITNAYYDYVAPLGVYVERSLALRLAVGIALLPAVALAAFLLLPWPLQLALAALLLWRLRRSKQRAPQLRASRHRASCGVAAAAAALILCTAGSASAQLDDPYWRNFDGGSDTVRAPVVHWNVGLRLGPYLPDVDSEFATETPYETMFGGAGLMGVVDIERFFVYPGGQLGIAGSLGFTSKSAKAFEAGTMTRSAEDNAFRMIPSSVGLVYRFTQLADNTWVPLVPYGRAGLAYYLWWVDAPGSGVAEAPADPPGCQDPQRCNADHAIGASLGYQVSVGLAIRAEALDPAAERGLMQEGIEHAGFYGELQYAKVDGFGADDKLTVGDLTWFAGMNFEF